MKINKYNIIIVLFCLFAVTSPLHAIKPSSFQKEALEVLDHLWLAIRHKHFDDSLNGKNWKKIKNKYLLLIKKTSNSYQLVTLLNKMVKEIGQSHIIVLEPKKSRFQKPTSFQNKKGTIKLFGKVPADIGTRLCIADNKVCILNIKKNSPAEKAGLKMGDAILKIDDYNINLNEKHQQPWDIVATRMLAGAPKTSVTLTILNKNNKKKKISLLRKPTGTLWQQIGVIPFFSEEFHSKILTNNIGYIYFSPCYSQNIMKFRQVIPKMKNMKGLIIDVRNNPGGLATVAEGLIGLLSKKVLLIGRIKTKYAPLRIKTYPQENAYTGKIAILTNKGTCSTAEIFAAAMQDNKLATIFGSTTGGQCLTSQFIEIKRGYRLQTVVGEYQRITGKPIEGQGVSPDVKVIMKRNDLIEGKDTTLEVAKNYILGLAE